MEKLIKKAIYKRLVLEDKYNGQEIVLVDFSNGAFTFMVLEMNLLCTYKDMNVTITKVQEGY
jgi:hypothetical protein